MTLIKIHTVSQELTIRLVDYAIRIFEELPTKSSVKKAIKSGELQICGMESSTGTFIKKGMTLELYDLERSLPKPYEGSVEALYEDDDLAVVHKPPGMPTSGNQYRTLENILVGQFQLPKDAGFLKWPKPVHRLDSLTSGLVIVAKTIQARFILGKEFEGRSIHKTYHALVMGETPEAGTLSYEVENKPAKTTFKRLDHCRSLKNDYLSLLELHPESGRTHQIRIHCAKAGYPVYGDHLYAKETIRGKGLFLFASSLRFKHPISGAPLEVTIDLPANFHSRMKSEQRRWNKYHMAQ